MTISKQQSEQTNAAESDCGESEGVTIKLQQITSAGFAQSSPVLPETEVTTRHDSLTDSIFNLILDEWMFGFGSLYQADDYSLMRRKIHQAVSASTKLTFMVPGFPAKSPNAEKKVMGLRADMTEFIAIRVLQKTLRKIEAVHKPGVEFVVMSDYHTFDQYLGIAEEDYFAYHASLKELIDEAGCTDIIRVISLSDFPEFKDVPTKKISKKLFDDYGGQRAVDTFDERLKLDQKFLDSYTQMTKFMTFDQEHTLSGCTTRSPQRSPVLPRKFESPSNGNGQSSLLAASDSIDSDEKQSARPKPPPSPLLRRAMQTSEGYQLLTPPCSPKAPRKGSPNLSPSDSPDSGNRSPSSPGGSPRSKASRRHIRNVVRGMMVQGQCLDAFLKLQTKLTDYIRLSIHHHPPKSGKFSLDLFKGHNKVQGVLRTAWHHSIVFDTKLAQFVVAHREDIEKEIVPNSCLISVMYKEQDWFFLRLYFEEDFVVQNNTQASIQASMAKGSCGIVLKVNQGPEFQPLSAHVISPYALTALVKEFGVVVLRGFQGFETPEQMLEFYAKRSPKGFVEWGFGPLKSVQPDEDVPGIVNSALYLPLHFDLALPPKYLGCDQKLYRYEDYIPREFVLYCKTCPAVTEGKGNGATTFVDCKGAVLSMHGEKIQEWKETVLSYETELLNPNPEKKVYFGGRGAVYEYPLVMACPWTGQEVLRWNETISLDEIPESDQELWLHIESSPRKGELTPKKIEAELRKVSMAQNVYFEHVYETGDQVYVNNYTTLHGRNGFGGKRELWRIQALPESDKIPPELGRKKQ